MDAMPPELLSSPWVAARCLHFAAWRRRIEASSGLPKLLSSLMRHITHKAGCTQNYSKGSHLFIGSVNGKISRNHEKSGTNLANSRTNTVKRHRSKHPLRLTNSGMQLHRLTNRQQGQRSTAMGQTQPMTNQKPEEASKQKVLAGRKLHRRNWPTPNKKY